MPTVQPATPGRIITLRRCVSTPGASRWPRLLLGFLRARLQPCCSLRRPLFRASSSQPCSVPGRGPPAAGEPLWVWGEDCVWHSVISDSGMSARCQQRCWTVHALVPSPRPDPRASFWGPHVRKSSATHSRPQDGKPESSYSISSFLPLWSPRPVRTTS